MDLKKHIPWVIGLALVALWSQWFYLHTTLEPLADYLAVDYINYEWIVESFIENKEWPHWAPYLMGGQPYFAHPQNTIFYPTTLLRLLLWFLPTVQFLSFLNWLTVFLGGLFMYIFMYYLTKSRKAAFMGGLVFLAAGTVPAYSRGWFYRANAIIWTPLIAMYLIKAMREKKWLQNAVIAGLFLSLSFHASGLLVFMFLVTLFIAFAAAHLLGKKWTHRLLKLILINAVVGLVLFGVAMIKLLPLLEFNQVSSKQADFTFEQSVGKHLKIEKFTDLHKVITHHIKVDYQRTGLIALILAAFSFPLWRKRLILFFFLMVIFTLLVVTGSPFYKLYYNFIPGFSKLHHVERSMYLFTFGIAGLAGYGIQILLKKSKRFTKKTTWVYVGVVALLLIDLIAISPRDYHQYADFHKQMHTSPLWQRFVADDDLYRVHSLNTRMIGGRATDYAAYLGQEILYGQSTIWIFEYFNEYLGVSSAQPAKFWGMLNTKYVYTTSQVNVSGLRFVEEVDRCTDCNVFEYGKRMDQCIPCNQDEAADQGIDGPFLYQNDLFLPRAYMVPHTVLITGDSGPSKQSMYGLLLENFHPASTAIVLKEGAIRSGQGLEKYDAIILIQGSVDDDSGLALQQYVNQGGTLLPNIVANENSVDITQIRQLFASYGGDYNNITPAEFTSYTPNRREIAITEPGHIILSEKFFLFEGWKAKLNGKEIKIERANGINSILHLPEPGVLVLEYKPKSFRDGAIITFITLVASGGYLVFALRKKTSGSA